MLEGGYIKLHRSLLKWEWYDDINTSRLFIHLLITVNHKNEKWHGILVKRGERVTSYGKLAKETRLTVMQIRTSLDKLILTGEVTRYTTNKYTVISVENYDKYQMDNTQHNTQITIKSTNKQQSNNKQVTTKEESKKARNIILTDNIKDSAEWKSFVSMRNKIKKPLTGRASTMALNKLNEIAPCDVELQKKIIDQSVFHCWQSFYPLKQEQPKQNLSDETQYQNLSMEV